MRAALLLATIAFWLWADTHIWAAYLEEKEATVEGGKECQRRIDAKAKIRQDVIDDYNRKDREIDVWPFVR